MKHFICLFLLCTLSISSASNASEIRTVALSGQQAPGTPDGETFNSFISPVLNDAGQTAFFAFQSPFTNSMGLWSEGSGNLALVARSGQQTPGLPIDVDFIFFSGFDRVVLNDAGQTIFKSFIFGPGVGSNDESIWSEGSGALALVAREGDPAPGTPNGVVYSHLESIFRLNDVGQSVFQADVAGSGVDTTNDRGIWLEGSDGIALMAREGMPAPGLPSGVNLASMGSFSSVALNDFGQTAFRPSLTGAGVNSTNNDSIYLGGSGGLALVAREGSQAPSTPSGVNFEFGLSIALALNNAGQTAFASRLTGSGVDSTNNGGIWSDRSGSLALVARNGDPAPGSPTGVSFTGFGNTNSFALNDAGQIAFISVVTGSGVDSTNNAGIWSDRSGSLAMVARRGDHAPGTPDGVIFSSTSFGGSSPIVLNSAGQIAFNANLTDSGGAFAGSGFWATNRGGDLQLIVRTGDLLEITPGDFRTISGLIFPNSTTSTGNSDGRPSFFNNLGQLAFQATFTDGSSGVFVSNRVAVPEPSALLLSAMIGLGLLWRRCC